MRVRVRVRVRVRERERVGVRVRERVGVRVGVGGTWSVLKVSTGCITRVLPMEASAAAPYTTGNGWASSAW